MNELIKTNGKDVLKSKEYSPEQIALIKRTVAYGATDDEFAMFMYLANQYDLDPFKKEIQFYKQKRWNEWKNDYDEIPVILTGRDGYLSIAHRSGNFNGMKTVILAQNPQGDIKECDITPEGWILLGAKCYVWNKAFSNVIESSVKFKEFCRMRRDRKTGKIVPMATWANQEETMIKKVAEAHALRRAFDIKGIYVKEEIEGSIESDNKTEIEYASHAIDIAEKLYTNPDEYKKFAEKVITTILESLESIEAEKDLWSLEKKHADDFKKLNNADREFVQLHYDNKRQSIVTGEKYESLDVIGEEGNILDYIKKEPKIAPINIPEIIKSVDEEMGEKEIKDKAFVKQAVSQVQGMTDVISMKDWLDKNKTQVKNLLPELGDYFKALFDAKWKRTDKSGQVKYSW